MRLHLYDLEERELQNGSQTWVSVAQIWLRIRPLSSRFSSQAGVGEVVATHAIRLRYIDGVQVGMRFRGTNRIFHIHSVENIGNRNRWLTCICEERNLVGVER